jgi:hypothetical protein
MQACEITSTQTPSEYERTTIDVIVTEERGIDNLFRKFKLACEKNPPGWGFYEEYESMKELAKDVNNEVAKHNVDNPHFHIIPY